MLAFARETRLIETTFVQPATADGADYRNRIWTPAEEMPFAGHPSLGTAVAVALERGEERVTYRQQTHAGVQPVEVDRDGDRASAWILQEPAAFGDEVDRAAVMAAIGLRPDDADPELPPQHVSTGLATLVVPVADAEAVSRARRDRAAIARLAEGTFNLYLCAVHGDTARARSFPSELEGEDPATGSAAGPLLAYAHERLGVERLEVTQGVEMGRPSLLACTAWRAPDGIRASVGGGCVPVLKGEISL
jgi:trans-2,3-dihydro-3-hydroxyanthranilate isomerase